VLFCDNKSSRVVLQMKDFRKFFPYLNNQKTIYFDNAATNLKLEQVIVGENEFLRTINANPHTRDFDAAFTATEAIEDTRQAVAEFLNINDKSEIIFTSGTTHSLNQIVFGWRKNFKKGSNIVINHLEHSSNVLPFLALEKEGLISVRYTELKEDGTIDIDKIKDVVDENTTFFSFASVSNTIGATNEVAEIVKKVKEINKETLVIVDAAQSVAHLKTDLKEWNADFLAFSAHKIFGPFGLGVLFGKKQLLEKMDPIFYGGGNNHSISEHDFELSQIPDKFEAGTPNVSAIYAFKSVFSFLKSEVTLNEIHETESNLKKYALEKAKNLKNKNVNFYNLNNDGPILLLNVEGIPAQDLGTYLYSEAKIAVRTGSHCAKLLCEFNGCKTSVRASFSFLNTKEEIDILMEALEKSSENWLNAVI
jgi:cysteine desulfurase/selenocysteine lyase